MKKRANNLYILLFLLKNAPCFVLLTFFSAVLTSLPSYISNVYFLKLLLNKLENNSPIADILLCLLGWIGFMFICDVYAAVCNELWMPKIGIKLEKLFFDVLSKKTKSINLLYFDNPEYYDNLIFSANSIIDNSKNTVKSMCDFTASIITVSLSIGTYLNMAGELILIVGIATVLSFLVKSVAAKISTTKDVDLVMPNRKSDYYKNEFFTRESIKERMMYNVDDLLIEKYKDSVDAQVSVQKRYGKKLVLLNWIQDYFCSNILLVFGILIYLLYQFWVHKSILISDFVPLYNSASIISSELVFLFGTCIPSIIENGRKIEKYRLFMDLKDDIILEKENCIDDVPEDIVLSDVSFAYPHCNNLVLKNINVELKAGQVIALVGRNGAGKSTFASVLNGLYVPTKGEIYIGGKLLDERSLYHYRHSFNSVYQDDQLLHIKLSENIALDCEYDQERVSRALFLSGLLSDEKKFGLGMYVGREIYSDGLILSGGETQKVLLARSFYRDLPYIILDEPSAALDAQAEYEFNCIVSNIAKKSNKTILIITHRLSTVTMADYIYVIENGEIAENGTFDTLKQSNGLFRKMWDIQSEKYKIIKEE